MRRFSGDNFVNSPLAPTRSEAETGAPIATVVVSHSSPVVTTGIASTLRRLPGYQIQIMDPHDGQHPPESFVQGNVVIVGDHAGVDCFPVGRSTAHAAMGSRAVMLLIRVTASKRVSLSDLPNQGIHTCLPIDCREDELLDAVGRLVEDRASHGAGFKRMVGGLAPAAKRRVREFIETNIRGKIEIDTLASIAGLSKCHFSRAFRQTFGSAPHRFLLERRIAVAANLIRTSDRPLTDVSLEAGFADQSHLTRHFARFMGDTPGNFRRRHQPLAKAAAGRSGRWQLSHPDFERTWSAMSSRGGPASTAELRTQAVGGHHVE